ncbi:P-loop NTPase fold protein, partial [Phocaeicola dorei]|uniref:P-loop NTPase fold protein n=1 Tax=Phocaeicola dorei TaxID=357276 RepID=UPI000FF4AFC1
MNTLILDFLNSYADNTNPQYAVMLKGKWGCGKTHLIKEWKKKFDGTADTGSPDKPGGLSIQL